ncbi:asparaginase domain-containing protein [Allorhizobium sp. BGMRC 0089]|uniref:asparaginase domain-containing protein n=1 Tax=Allorhizobium sonneratiae TaxID=2934936 RepID=UPI002034344B|nr:asparaginase domain-containing protein [Allorhizobium sonneratiae]MCM2293678.1 asparaginase domain-containing protein [Allorhizobium sonneratiae]
MKIAIINTGGTISCVGNPLAPMSSAAFKAASAIHLDPILKQTCPGLDLDYVTDLAFPESASGMLDSTNLQPSDWCLIARYILEHYDEADGWVVLHGTDTMDFSGTALSMLLGRFRADGTALAQLSKPVILTGSQVPLFHADQAGIITGMSFNTDAFQNVCGAVAAAATGLAGLYVFFNSHLMRGSRVVKTDANQFHGFTSPNFPDVGQYGITLTLDARNALPFPLSDAVSLDHPTARAATLAQLQAIFDRLDQVPVMQLNAFPAWYRPEAGTALLANLIRAVTAEGIRGLVLEAYGEGNFPSGNPNEPEKGAIARALKEAADQGVVIVDNTQVLKGAVDYNAYAAGAWLPGIGALNPADMTPMASLAKLTVLLAAQDFNGWTAEDLRYLMQVPLVGEMQDGSRLDSRMRPVMLPGQALTTFTGGATLNNLPAHGPVLSDAAGHILWAMLEQQDAAALPGRLLLKEDGNLIFYSRNGKVLWQSGTTSSGTGATLLSLRQNEGDKTIRLAITCQITGKVMWEKTVSM